ncbi:MAG: YejG family protein [Sodalis sp. (in: enterobacteria)]|uniref:YejG family protein n=1 Tax=Sodalis sp. (in: enterobacteria) TaxID=1898979 RepID=UPI003F2F5B99
MNLHLSVVHRLPHQYRCLQGYTGVKVESVIEARHDDNVLIGLTLLSHGDDTAWQVMRELARTLAEMDVSCSIVECDGKPCLFLHREDECAGLCRIKNIGVAVAEPAGAPHIA